MDSRQVVLHVFRRDRIDRERKDGDYRISKEKAKQSIGYQDGWSK